MHDEFHQKSALPVKRVVLFSSYFESSRVPAYIFFYLSQLRNHSDFLVYVTTDDKVLATQDIDDLKLYADEVVQVRNEGYDFGMWQKMLQKYDVVGRYDELCLVNDSCVCFDSLTPYFKWHKEILADVSGMTLSYDTTRHLQSFFLCIKKPAITDAVTYIEQLELQDASFEQVISRGELGLSRMLQEKGFSIQGFYQMPETDKGNPTYARCVDLIRADVPLIKKKLFLHYSSHVLKQLLYRKGAWRHQALIDEIQSKTGLSDNMLKRLFAWRTPRRMTMRERVRTIRWWVKYKLGKL